MSSRKIVYWEKPVKTIHHILQNLNQMNQKTLVCYASKYGSTREIAERIHAHFLECDELPKISSIELVDEPEKYDVIILGTAMYRGKWRKEAVHFLNKYEQVLKNKSVWIFCSGPTGRGDPCKLLNDRVMPESIINKLQRIDVNQIKIFHGALKVENLSYFERLIIKATKAEIGDFRNWSEIDTWAEMILKEDIDQGHITNLIPIDGQSWKSLKNAIS